MPKILFSANSYSSLYNFRNEIIRKYIDEGYEVFLLAPYDNTYLEHFKSMGCCCFSLSMVGKSKNPFKEFKVILQYYSIYKKIHPDLIYHYTIKPNVYGAWVASWLKIPFVNFVTGLGTAFIEKGFTYKIVALLYKMSFPKAKKIVVLNQDDFNELATLIPNVKEKLYLLPSEGIVIADYKPIKKTNEQITFLMIGRAIKQKGILEYFEASKRLKLQYPTIQYAFMGEIGSSNSSALTQEELDIWFKGQSIDYWGYHKDIQHYIAQSSCVVLPSYREGVPISLLEAMAMEKPIITTDAPGCKDVIQDSLNGFCCKKQDTESLYQAMEKFILLDEKERQKMGAFARQQVIYNYSMDIIWQHYKQIEQACLTSKN